METAVPRLSASGVRPGYERRVSGRYWWYSWCVALCLLTVSCKDWSYGDGYHYIEVLPEEGWSMEREIFFSTSQLEVGKPYDIELVLRLERGHRYRSLPLGVTFESPDRQISTKVVQIPLQHQRVKTGGYSIVEQLVPLEHGVSFSKEGVYTYSIRHLSTDSVIPGVIEVGLIIEPVK